MEQHHRRTRGQIRRVVRLLRPADGGALEGSRTPLPRLHKEQRVTHIAVVENKRLGHALAIVKAQQDLKQQTKVLTNSEKTGYKKRPRRTYGPDYEQSESAPAAVEMWKSPKSGDYTHPHRTTTATVLN